MSETESERGTLKPGEKHPAAEIALQVILDLGMEGRLKWLNAFSSCAIEGNRLAEVCAETLRRIMDGGSVSDRYLMGLAWAISPAGRTPDAADREALRKVREEMVKIRDYDRHDPLGGITVGEWIATLDQILKETT